MRKAIVKFLSFFILSSKKRKAFRGKHLYPNKIKGNNNKIIKVTKNGDKEIYYIENCFINIEGNNNIIKIPENHKIKGYINITTDNTIIDIKSTETLNITINTHDQSNQKLVIENGTKIFGATFFLNELNSSIIIGENCLFSGNIVFWATDGHAILDKQTDEILNPVTKPIIIEDHCWIGWGVLFTKNASLSSNTVVGGGSVVTKAFTQENVIIAGNPAKIVKENTNWNHKTASLLLKERNIENVKSA